MTVSVQTNRDEFTGNGVTTAFATTFEFQTGTDLKVYLDGVLKTITTHYTVSGGAGSTGTVTFLVAPANGLDVVIYDDPPVTQGTDYTPNDAFPAESHELALDKVTRIARRLKGRVDRAVVLTDSDTSGADVTLPSPAADEVIKWNAAGNGLESALIADLGAVEIPVPISKGGTNATTLEAARDSLGVNDFVSISDYASLAAALATGKRVVIPPSVTSISVSTTDSVTVLQNLYLIDAMAPLTLALDAGVHTTASGNIANVGQNGNITITGATPVSTTVSSIASVSGSSGSYTVVVNVADATGISVGHFLKLDNVVPLIHLSGDLSVARQREAQNELLRTSALLGTITATTGGGSASWSSVGAGVMGDYVAVGDLLTIKGQTRVVSSLGASSVNITGAWTLGVSASSDYFISRPNSGTVSTAGAPSTTVTGSSSAFTTEANVGDVLLCDGQMAVITAIASATSMTVSPAVTITAGTAYSIITPAVAHEGTHRVTNVAGNAVTVLNHWRGPFAPPVNLVSGGDVQAIKTVLYNSGSGDGFSFSQNSSVGWINDLVIRGNNASTGTHGIALNGRTTEGPTQIGPTGLCCTGDGFAAVEWGRGAFIGVGGSLQSRKSHYCGNLAFGIWSMEGAKVGMREAIVSGNNGRGLQINAGSTLLFTEGHAAGNASDGANMMDGSTIYGEIPFFWQNGGVGLRLGGTAGCHISNGVVGLNADSGVYAHYNASCDLSLCLVVGNARENVEAYGNATIYGADMSSIGCRGTSGNGRGIYAESSRIYASNCAIIGNSGGPVELLGAGGLFDAPSSYITGTANGGIRVRKNSQAVLTSGKPAAVTAASGGSILIDSVSPAPTISGPARVNEVANDGAIVSDAAGTAFGIAGLKVAGTTAYTLGFFSKTTVVHDFPSIAAQGVQTVDVTVTGALATTHVAAANSNSLADGVVLSARIISTNTVRVYAHNPSSGAIDPGNATITVAVFG